MLEAEVRREIQTELRQFDGNLRAQALLSDALQNFQIVCGNLLRLGAVLDIFSQVRENSSDLLPTQNLGCAKCIIEPFAGHEPRHAPPDKRVIRCTMPQPLVLRCREQHRSHKTHECSASFPGMQTPAASKRSPF